ncbi:glycosyltransferase [Aerococcus urinaeequi]|uniref:glycosyltransferase n=1 Tax=Aerococcus urinaeequi TaxID=51665 RepID=UPI003D6B9A49
MQIVLQIIFWFCIFIVFWAMIGYPISILLLDKIIKPKRNKKVDEFEPTVTVMVVAHNEEKVIENKLYNLLEIDYPQDKIQFMVASDNSTDKTNEIIEKFNQNKSTKEIKLIKSTNHMGKTNAQNEAQKYVTTEFLVMTDANSMIEKNAIKELMSSFSKEDISYVAGKLEYINANDDNETSQSESSYWNLDLKVRDIESRLKTITAGNGALYAVRNNKYVDVNPIYSHDSEFPIIFGLNNERAIANNEALVFEKAGENDADEFGRKVRMNRVILDHIVPSWKIFNLAKYGWFSYFYFGHRTSRYLLWLAHILLLVVSVILAIDSSLFLILLFLQILFYLIGFLYNKLPIKNPLFKIINYYTMTIWAQIVGVYRIVTGKVKPTWEKAESTR